MDVMKNKTTSSSLNHSAVAELSTSPHEEVTTAICVDGGCLASQMPGDDAAVKDCARIRKRLSDDVAKNGFSRCLSADDFYGCKQRLPSEAALPNHRAIVGVCGSDSKSQLNDPNVNGPLVVRLKDGADGSEQSGVQAVPVSGCGNEADGVAEDVKESSTDVVPNRSDFRKSSVVRSEILVGFTSGSVSLPAVVEPMLNDTDDLFDASIIAPISLFDSSVAVLGSPESALPASLRSLPLENHDVCQSVMMTEVLKMGTDLDGFTSLQTLTLSTPNGLVSSRVCSVVKQLDSCLDASVKSELQSKSQGLLSVSRGSPTQMRIPNGVSFSSSKSDVLPAILRAAVGMTVASDGLLTRDQNSASVCDRMMQGFSENGVGILAENAFPTSGVPVSFSNVGGDGASLGVDSVDGVTISSEENVQVADSFQSSACEASKSSSIFNEESPSGTLAKPQDSLDSLPTAQSRAPRARKSCGARQKELRQMDSSRASLPGSEATGGCGLEAPAVTADAVPARSNTLSNMTIKLPELENVLGIGYKSLDKMDAKTLDRIVLAKAQKKARMEAELGRSKMPLRLDGLGRCSRSSSISETTMQDCSSSRADKGREIMREASKRTVSLTEETSGKQSTKTSHGDSLTNGFGPCVIKDASKENKFIPVKTEKSWNDEGNDSIAMNSDHGHGKGLSEKCENSVTQTRVNHESRESGMSGHITSSVPSVTVANGMIFKARKSQGYAFGRVKRVRDILNSPELLRPASMTKTTAGLDGSGDASCFTVQDKTGKETASTHSFVKPKNRNTQSLTDITGSLSESERKQSEAESKSQSLKRKPNGRFCSPLVLDDHPSKSKRQKLMSHAGESYPVSPGKATSKHDTADRASMSSSSSTDNFSVKLPRKASDKISYPVTPPRSPEASVNQSSDELSSHANSESNGYLKQRCCCQQSVTISLGNVATCQALESIDGKIVGCTRRWTNKKIVRPSTRIPFMAMCDRHVQLLSDHQCCPGCGQFCVQGEFYQCKPSSTGEVHTFHRRCQVFHEKGYLCLHCGAQSVQQSVVLQATELFSSSQNASKYVSRLSRNARLGFSAARRQSVSSATSKNSQPEESNSLGINRKELEASIAALVALGKEKQKKIRPCAKSFYAACKNGELDRVLYMIDEGIDPNLRPDDYSESCLHLAVRHGQKEVVKLLLQAGALPNSLDLSLYTPIMVAAVSGRLALLEILVGAGGSLHYRAVDGMTVLHLAAKSGQLDIIHFLLENYQMDVNVKDDGGWTPVIWATEYKHITTVKYLLKMGANPNIQDKELNTGLHWAAYAGCCRIAEMFLNSGCDVECANEHGDRPLHITARQDHYECVSFLLMRGADAGALNKADMTPAECCPEKSTSTRSVLLINQHIKRSAALRPNRPERLVHHDVSLGREFNPVTVVNGVDNLGVPEDFTYVADYVETNTININRVITSLRMCTCKEGGSGREECSTINCNCMRSSIKCWYDKEGHLVEEFNYHDPPLIYECNRACKCHANCQNRVIQLGIVCRLQVFRTHHRGWGCRTLLNISKGSFVCEYFGELISDAEADRRRDDSYLFDLDNQDTETFCVDAAKFGNVSRFINHLCEPNLTPVKVFVDHQDLRFPRMCFFANRDIKANDELGFDYGDKFWVIKYKDFTCDCGSPKCRYSVNTIGQTLEDFKRRQDEESANASRT